VSVARGRRAVGAVVASGFLAAAFLLPARRPLPFDVCALRRLTGLPCLTCGLTRSVCLMARGDWRGSLEMHPAGGLVLLALAIGACWLVAEAAFDRELGPDVRSRLLRVALAAGAILSVLGWSARLSGLLPPV